MSYNAAFTFWSVKGALAEAWAHGVFGGVSDQGNQIVLSEDLNDLAGRSAPGPKSAIGGIVTSSFIWEEVVNRREATRLAREWLGDCLDVLHPRLVHGLHVKQLWIQRVRNQDGALRQMFGDEAEASQLEPPDGYSALLPGRSFNSSRDRKEGTRVLTCSVGGLRPDMAVGYFGSVREIDNEPAIGAFIEHFDRCEAGFGSPSESLKILLSDSEKEAQEIVGRTLRRVTSA